MIRAQTSERMPSSVKPLELLSLSGRKQVPMIMQSEVAECGLASIAMISSYYGNKVNIASLRGHMIVGNQGMNLKQMMEASVKLGLTSRAIQCPMEDIKQLVLPCILHWELDHFVVLTGISKRGIHVNDPAVGKRILTLSEFSNSYTGIVLELSPSPSFKKKDQRVVIKISQMWEHITGLKRSLISLLLLSIVMQSAALLSPYYMQWVVDNVLMSNDKPLLIVLAIGFGGLSLIQIVVQAFRSWLIVRFSSAINIQMGANLFHHLIRLPMTYFEKRHIGDVVSRFSSINSIRELLTTGIVEAVIDGLMASVVLIMMYLYSPILTFIVFGAALLTFFIQLLFYFPNRRITEESIIADANENSSFLETFRGIQTIKLFSHETIRQNNWLNRYAEVINSDIRLGKLEIAEDSAINLIFSLEMTIVVYFGALVVMEGGLTVGMLLAFMAYKNQFTTSITKFIDKIFSFKLLALHLERLSDITLESRERSNETRVLPQVHSSSLKVENVSFRYSDNTEWVVKDLSFEVKPGECVAITGPSGCGKTTLMKLLLGLQTPTKGKIYVDGVDIQKLSLNDYRKHLGSVMQNDKLLSGTLSENLTMFDPDYDYEKMLKCCEQANVLDDIQSLPMGFNSLVGDMGSNLSGGQLQRIFLARALYKSPKLLFLDESTSHLDDTNEDIINQNVSKLNMTRILIAHRKETINSADRIIDLSHISPK
ncbi:Putative toxin transporter [Vibrio jasicida]|uniref:Toxin transporter n=3 Tax=Vibrio jasicida TaxID=766224 RepID=A0AAU9QW00_9VIBR|nr:Putative toxin transporter [Vibrio jasicida]CAH1602991.1 Putative toxin transporter [Vibrio jasicida]